MLLLALVASACRPPPPPARDAYVWQRRWTEAVESAVVEGAPLFDGYRPQVLAYDEPSAPPKRIEIDLDVLRRAALPITLVARIERERPEPGAVARDLMGEAARAREAGVEVSGVEIDFDAPTSGIAAYGRWLSELRGAVSDDLALSITALPAWCGDPSALSAALAPLQHAVLQVHAVDAPSRGLFSAARAERHAERFSEISPVPFRLALPAYGASLDRSGSVLSEAERPEGGEPSLDLWADPAEVLAARQALIANPPRGYAGELWFRLPVEGDMRAWTLPMLREVLEGRLPEARLSVHAQRGPSGAIDLELQVEGAVAVAPAAIRISGSCSAADGIAGYAVRRSRDGVRFEIPHPPILRPGQPLAIGWIRCLDGWRTEEP